VSETWSYNHRSSPRLAKTRNFSTVWQGAKTSPCSFPSLGAAQTYKIRVICLWLTQADDESGLSPQVLRWISPMCCDCSRPPPPVDAVKRNVFHSRNEQIDQTAAAHNHVTRSQNLLCMDAMS